MKKEAQRRPAWTTHALAALAGALAAPAMAQTPPASSVTLYGQATAALTYKNHQTGGTNVKEVSNSALASTLFGFRGTEDLGGGMVAVFRLESAMNTDNGTAGATVGSTSKFWNRQSYVGIGFNPMVLVTVGRQFHVSADRVIQSLDVYNVAGPTLHVTPLGLFGVNRYVGNDSRVDDSIKVRLRGPAGVTGAVSFGADDGAGRSYALDLAQVTQTYHAGAYAARFQSPTVIAATGQRPEHTVWGVGGQHQVGPVRLFLHYAQSELDSTTANRPVQKNRLIAPALSAGLGVVTYKLAYYHDKGTNLNGVAGRNGIKETLVTSAEYYLSKRTSLYAAAFSNRFKDGYKLDPVNIAALTRDAAANSTSGFSLGMRHDF